MENSTQVKKPSDTKLLNFMLNDCVDVRCYRVSGRFKFRAKAEGDWVFGHTPRDAIRGLYILRRRDDDNS
jgi:hypothetical protein